MAGHTSKLFNKTFELEYSLLKSSCFAELQWEFGIQNDWESFPSPELSRVLNFGGGEWTTKSAWQGTLPTSNHLSPLLSSLQLHNSVGEMFSGIFPKFSKLTHAIMDCATLSFSLKVTGCIEEESLTEWSMLGESEFQTLASCTCPRVGQWMLRLTLC